MTQPSKLFTKSAFKIAMSCPQKIYYARNPEQYENADDGNDFLKSLAEGGFQVGELAKIYGKVPESNDLKNILGYEPSLLRTQQLMEQENVNIAEAAFRWGNLFVRVDVLQKEGNHIRLIEVKAKSWNPETDKFMKKDGRAKDAPVNTVNPIIREYVYDVAFQKYVVVNALQELYPGEQFKVEARLMMADKSKRADFDGMNQLFKIVSDDKGRSTVIVQPNAMEKLTKSNVEVLTAFDVDDICDRIIAGTTSEQITQDITAKNGNVTHQEGIFEGLSFKDFVQKAADCYCQNHRWPKKPILSGDCFGCPYKTVAHPELKSGMKECWTQYVSAEDFEHRPQVKELSGFGLAKKRGEWVEEGVYFLDWIDDQRMPRSKQQVYERDLEKEALRQATLKRPRKVKKEVAPFVHESGLDHYERKWLQIGLALNKQEILDYYRDGLEGKSYIAASDLSQEMAKWKFPLHMIDFETTAVALPYYKDKKPYEQVAFQFSHHIIRKVDRGAEDIDYEIEHAGQYLNEHVEAFPNFEFVRELKRQLSADDGTIFRYAMHENNILRCIADQLKDSNEPDREELIAWIRTITYSDGKDGSEPYTGERNMVDLLDVVRHYFYNYDEMHGSNSIKQVLPAVLNSSQRLQLRYGMPADGSLPIYGRLIKSLNISTDEPMAWIKYLDNGRVDSPYHQLPPVGQLIGISQEELDLLDAQEAERAASDPDSNTDASFSVANGGAALTAYSKLMFCHNQEMTNALRQALLRYCELDTLAMVFIWEYFWEKTRSL